MWSSWFNTAFIQIWLQVVAILKYFRPMGSCPLHEKVLAKAIELPNGEVEVIVRRIATKTVSWHWSPYKYVMGFVESKKACNKVFWYLHWLAKVLCQAYSLHQVTNFFARFLIFHLTICQSLLCQCYILLICYQNCTSPMSSTIQYSHITIPKVQKIYVYKIN